MSTETNTASCACEKCVAGCQTMPGMLAPDDLVAILKHLGVRDETAPAFLAQYFRASDGAKVIFQGQPLRRQDQERNRA